MTEQQNQEEGRIINAQEQGPVHVRLPLVPGAIVGGHIRQRVYELIEADVQAFKNKWGFNDLNIQAEWPDAPDQPPITIFNCSLEAYKGFLAQMLMKIATLSPANRIKFVRELVQVLGQLGYLPQVKNFIDQAMGVQEQEFRPPVEPEEE